jgi:plasmid stabilization system protein ParE
MTFKVLVTPQANEDLAELLDFLLDRATSLEDLLLAQTTIETVRSILGSQLSTTPFSFRKAGPSPTRRELIIPFGATGYVALYEITGPSSVLVLAVRHQREEDYH